MSVRARSPALAALLLALAACNRAPPAPSASTTTTTTTSASTIVVTAGTTATATPATPIEDADERYLRDAEVTSIVPVRGPLARGRFEATLASPEGPRAAVLTIALTADPNAYKRPLAFAKLARAMGARVVPKTVLRHIAAGDLSALAGDAGDTQAIVREARVLNDGTVDVLLSSRSSAHLGSAWTAPITRIIDPSTAREMATWERWAASPEPASGEDPSLLRDYIEMIALDYLSANDARRSAQLAEHALLLHDNASAFPPHPDAAMVDRSLRRLRATARFPRAMRDALRAFDKDRSAAAFASGGFTTWLLTPRARVELDERRAALLTLIEAKIAAHGEPLVLSL